MGLATASQGMLRGLNRALAVAWRVWYVNPPNVRGVEHRRAGDAGGRRREAARGVE